MINVIKQNANNNLPPPEFVPKFERLHKPTEGLGCNQSLDKILAMADKRARKQKMALEIKKRVCEEKSNYLRHLIDSKQTRGQRFTNHIDLNHLQRKYLTLIKSILFIKGVLPVYKFMLKHQPQKKSGLVSVNIGRKVRMWYLRCRSRKYINFFNKIQKQLWMFSMGVRIRRKKKAADVLREFLKAASNNEIRVM